MEASSESIAGDGVADRQREESKPDGEHDDVKHLDAPGDDSENCPAGFAAIAALCLFRYCPDDVPLAAYDFEWGLRSAL